jgi:glutamate-ammonia-ligase adenylyltransferase
MTNRAEEIQKRLEEQAGEAVSSFFEQALDGNPDSEGALTNFERWLHQTGNPRLYLEQIRAQPAEARRLLLLMGASQPLADSLIQNPELGTVILDPREASRVPDLDRLMDEGARLLASATGSHHALDRLRYLKQRHFLPIAISDLTDAWPQETVWQALSDLADALIRLTLNVLWTPFAATKDLPADPPIAIVGFGKLGGRELNYSSDVDLAYVLLDGADERIERECSRFCEQLGRALSDRMGRGALYRVDLRLRPYGAAGPILRRFESYVGYYRLYAEQWEVQALLKSRVLAGAPLGDAWDHLVQERVYHHSLSEASLAEMLNTRARIEERALGDDLKRGAGGIRDVEFLCQTLQLANGFEHPSIRLRSTCEALRALAEGHLLEAHVAGELESSYTFLRKLEHRTQMVGDRQTHTVPGESLGRLMGMESWKSLSERLDFHRRTIQSLYRSILQQESESLTEREALADRAGKRAPALLQWFDVFPEAPAFYRSLQENEGSLNRVFTILDFAPKLVGAFKNSLELTELLLSGEIEESTNLTKRLEDLGPTAAPKKVAEALMASTVTACARWTLTGEPDLCSAYRSIYDALLRHCVSRLQGELDVVALGSYGSGEAGPGSDIDLVLLTDRGQAGAEMAGQELLGFLTQLKRFGPDLEVDLRLRPDGGKGLLVRSYDGFGSYEISDMEMWERFALGHARLVSGREEAIDLVKHAAYALPLTPDRLQELLAVKRRIETERLKPQHRGRDVKLGNGGLNDVEWTVHLTEMRYPTATRAGETADMEQRIRNLGRASLLNAVEVDGLLSARAHLLEVRTRLYLLEAKHDLVPENPDRLNRLAEAVGLPDGNDFLRKHRAVAQWVRDLFLSTLERLKA